MRAHRDSPGGNREKKNTGHFLAEAHVWNHPMHPGSSHLITNCPMSELSALGSGAAIRSGLLKKSAVFPRLLALPCRHRISSERWFCGF